jgi:O-antigen/teichoic acid export membrane protein
VKKQIEKLARETALYSISSILGKFLNWMMVPLYTYVLPRSADYGIITNLYSWTALLLVFLTYGMETGFLRFANQRCDEADKVYSTTLISVGVTSLIFALMTFTYQRPLAELIGYANQPEFIGMLGTVVALDAVGCYG